MNLTEFITKYSGQEVKYQPTGLGGQCEDLANQYVTEVLGLPAFTLNAVDAYSGGHDPAHYQVVANTPSNFPPPGDIVIWGGPNLQVGTNQYGHIAICVQATPDAFVSFDQNWPEGSSAHEQQHSYVAVLGWLHPLAAPPPSPPPVGHHTPAEYQAAARVAHVDGLAHGIAVADCPAAWAKIVAYVKAQGG
jgi:hypothetical protein